MVSPQTRAICSALSNRSVNHGSCPVNFMAHPFEGGRLTVSAMQEARPRERPLARVGKGPNSRAVGHLLVPEARTPTERREYIAVR